jgi:hypothetical protein
MKTGHAILREKKRRPAARAPSDRGTQERGFYCLDIRRRRCLTWKKTDVTSAEDAAKVDQTTGVCPARHRDSDGTTLSRAKEKETAPTGKKFSSRKTEGNKRKAASLAPAETAAKRIRDPQKGAWETQVFLYSRLAHARASHGECSLRNYEVID